MQTKSRRRAGQAAFLADRTAELLLLPGTLCDERLFAPLLSHLPGQHARVADMTGATSVAGLAERILAAAPPRFALLGFSLGAIVAVEIALLAPERVLGLALVGANLRPVPVIEHAARRAAVARASAAGVGRHVVDELWPRYVGRAAARDDALKRSVAAMADGAGHATYADQTEVALGRADRRRQLSELAMPALVLCGDEDDVAPIALHREVAALLPRATLAVVPHAGHFVLLERPELVAAHVGGWLAELSVDGPVPADQINFIEEHV